MPGTTVHLTRSDALLQHLPPDTPSDRTLEYPDTDWVQLTYQWLRVGPEGDQIASIVNGDWYTEDDPLPWSDLVIHTSETTE